MHQYNTLQFFIGIFDIFCFINAEKASLSSSQPGICSADYYLKDGRCKPCPQGYFGPKCEHTCPYPTFGYRCLEGPCGCSKEQCNNTHGCLSASKLIMFVKKRTQMIQNEESTTFGWNPEYSTSMDDKTRQKSEPSRQNKPKEWSSSPCLLCLLLPFQ
ncbi:uncharacterized protein LOC134257064 [Saccostrea cucullata]|uniref:uncharacterized protein LOC134257064 n=1 Tax=Saccostrea cuccullata TaxID=36930 RepID=UPI002ED6979E